MLIKSGLVTDDLAAPAPSDAEAEAKATDRVVVFSDAVIAIAITLLALELPAPVGNHSWTNGHVLSALWSDRETYLDFFISFLVIGNHWASHRRLFRYVCRMNGLVGRLNMLWLLMLILTPPATRVLSGDGGRGARFTIYVVIQVIATLCLLGISEIVRRWDMLTPDAPASARRPDAAPYLALVIAFVLSVPVAFFTDWAYAIWAAIPLLGRGLHRLAGGPPSSGPRRPGPPAGRARPAHRG